MDRTGCYIANVVKCRPPANRDPEPLEVATCRHFLESQIELVSPKVIVSLGNFASRTLLGVTEGVTHAAGQVLPLRLRVLVPTFHPAYALRGGGVVVAEMRADFDAGEEVPHVSRPAAAHGRVMENPAVLERGPGRTRAIGAAIATFSQPVTSCCSSARSVPARPPSSRAWWPRSGATSP